MSLGRQHLRPDGADPERMMSMVSRRQDVPEQIIDIVLRQFRRRTGRIATLSPTKDKGRLDIFVVYHGRPRRYRISYLGGLDIERRYELRLVRRFL